MPDKVSSLRSSVVLTSDDLSNDQSLSVLSKYIQNSCVKFEVKSKNGGDITDGVPLKEQCRVLCDLDDFDLLYPFTLKCLYDKRLKVSITLPTCEVVVGDAYIPAGEDDLSTVMTCFAKWPVMMNWLCDFVGGYMSKKLPPLEKDALTAAAKLLKA